MEEVIRYRGDGLLPRFFLSLDPFGEVKATKS